MSDLSYSERGRYPPGLKPGDFIQTINHFGDIYFEVVKCWQPREGESGMLLKHGAPHVVDSWWGKNMEAYRAIGLQELVANVVVVSGAFPVDEINKCLSTSGYCRSFMERMASMIPEKPNYERKNHGN